jgi:prolyl oligopeptidase PreP (S9A serine peptidase family)
MNMDKLIKKNLDKVEAAVDAMEAMDNFVMAYDQNMVECSVKVLDIVAFGPTEEESLENAKIQAKSVLIENMVIVDSILKTYKEKSKKKVD